MSATASHSPDRLVTRATATVHRLPLNRATATQHILAVTFRSPEGRRWDAIGGGETVAEAVAWARGCCPDNTVWEIEHWNDLYDD